MLHQTFLFLEQLWQLFEVSQILEFLRYTVLLVRILKPTESKRTVCMVWETDSVYGKSMTFFCIPFVVLHLLSHVEIVVCICMYSILNKILFTLKLSQRWRLGHRDF